MGQKVDPRGIRIGITKSWDSKWFAEGKEYLNNFHEDIKIKGQQWKAAYLPVWLYSYQQVSGTKKVLHYVAVNARTKETMGSVPIHMPKLIGISILVEILGMLAMRYSDFDYNWLFLLSGIIYFIIII